jgi:serine protease Do
LYGRNQFFPPAAPGSYLGVGLAEIDDQRAGELKLPRAEGVEVTSIDPDSPADKAGLRKGDIIIEFRGQRVVGVEHFVRLVRETPTGRDADLTVWRGGAEQRLSATIGKRAAAKIFLGDCGDDPENCEIRIPEIRIPEIRIPDFDIPRMVMQSRVLGAQVGTLDGQFAAYFGVEKGLLVRSVNANSPAARAGLQAGDVVTAAAGKEVAEARQLRDALRSAGAGKPVEITVVRQKSKQTLKLEPGDVGESQPRPVRGVRGKKL